MIKLPSTTLDEKAESYRPGAFKQFNEVVRRKRPLLILLGIYALVYLVIKLVTINLKASSVIEFAYIAILFGLAPAYFFRKVFKFENIIGWLTNSGAFGILLIPYLFLTAGWLGINTVLAYNVVFLYLCSIIGIVTLLIFADDKFIGEAISFNKLVKLDIFMYVILSGYTFIFTIMNFSRVNAIWDAFTFWGLAAKYIYQFHSLPNSTLDVFSYFKYSAFHPIYFSVIYSLYDGIVERYASWINVFINFLALLLIYNRTLGRNFLEKLLVVTLLIITCSIAINANYMLSMLADTLCAFILLLYILVLTNADEIDIHTFSKRAALILLLTSTLFFIKSPFLVLTIALTAAWILYDYKFILRERISLIKRVDLWIAVITIGILYLMHFVYIAFNLNIQDRMTYDKLIDPVLTSLDATIVYAKELFVFITQKNPYLLVLWIFGLCLPFLAWKQKSINRQYIFINVLSFGIFFFYCFIYILNQRSLTSGSIVRYTSIFLYLLPLMVTFVHLQFSPRMVLPFVLVLIFIAGYSINQTITPITNNNIKLTTGSYSVFLDKYSTLAKRVLRITGDDAKILIADEADELLYTNMMTPAIYIRYFLMTNSVGGHFVWLSKDRLMDHALAYKADYILLISYQNTFDHCEDVFIKDHTYLIKLDGGIDSNTNKCAFTENTIVDFKKLDR